MISHIHILLLTVNNYHLLACISISTAIREHSVIIVTKVLYMKTKETAVIKIGSIAMLLVEL